jgi:hypothetical protein
MNLGDLVIGAVSVLWVLVCGLRWWVTDPRNVWQRRIFAAAAGLGAALFWIFGQMIWDVMGRANTPQPPAPTDIRIHAPQ